MILYKQMVVANILNARVYVLPCLQGTYHVASEAGEGVIGQGISGGKTTVTKHLTRSSSFASRYKPVTQAEQSSIVPFYRCPHLE